MGGDAEAWTVWGLLTASSKAPNVANAGLAAMVASALKVLCVGFGVLHAAFVPASLILAKHVGPRHAGVRRLQQRRLAQVVHEQQLRRHRPAPARGRHVRGLGRRARRAAALRLARRHAARHPAHGDDLRP